MGYAKGDQETQGIHFRLYSRAFIVAKPNQGRIVYVNCDMAMISTAVKTEVVRQLRSGHGQTYTEDNIMISATHTHSGPGGFLQYVLYIISTQGFNRQNFFIIVTGIVRVSGTLFFPFVAFQISDYRCDHHYRFPSKKSIERAHKSMKKGRLWFAEGVLNHANINRSPSGYAANPESEKAKYT